MSCDTNLHSKKSLNLQTYYVIYVTHMINRRFGIDGTSAAILATIRLLLVEKREPPCRRSDLLEYRSVLSLCLIYLNMVIISIFSHIVL